MEIVSAVAGSDGREIGPQEEHSAFLQNILESSTEYSIIGKDLAGKILLWNAGARRLYGYTPGEVIAKANSVILHTPEDILAGKPEEIMAAALSTGKWEGTLTRVRKNGQRFTARVVITPRRDAGGTAIGFLLISKDISDEIRLTEELKGMQFYARSLIEASLDPLVTISPEGKITDVNEGSINVTGISRERLIGTDFSDYFTEPEKARQGYQQVFSRGAVTDYPLTIRHRDGRLTDVLYNASVYKDAAGNVLGVFAAARDVTESRRAEQRFRTLIESAPDAMVLANQEGIILLVNNQTESLFGYTREEILGKSVEIFVPKRYRDAHPGNRAKFFGEPRLRPMGAGLDLWGVRKDGSEFPIEISLSPIESPQGLSVAATIRDVTRTKDIEFQIRSSLKEKEALLQEIHHRVKNNLQVIASLLSLQSAYITDPVTLTQFQESQGRIRSMALIHEKLYQSAAMASVDLADYVRSLSAILLRTYSANTNVSLVCDVDTVAVSIDAAVPIGLMLNELVTNALKYAFPRGRIGQLVVALKIRDDGCLSLCVQDDGIGLGSDFELGKANTLGLRLVRMFAKQLRAEVICKSEQGHTSFQIDFKEKVTQSL